MDRNTYPGTVLERLNRKLVALRELSRRPRPPPGTYVPRSLRDFARWHDVGLGIYPVGSPNEVATTHPRYGRIANEAQQLLERLRSTAAEKHPRARLGERCSVLQMELAKASERERALVGQFHMVQSRIEQLEKQLASANARQEYFAKQNSLLTKRVFELESVTIIHAAEPSSD